MDHAESAEFEEIMRVKMIKPSKGLLRVEKMWIY